MFSTLLYFKTKFCNVFHTQLEKAYLALMANLTRLLGALEHQDVDTVVQELKYIMFLEVQLIKVN